MIAFEPEEARVASKSSTCSKSASVGISWPAGASEKFAASDGLSVRELKTELEPELLRAVPLHEALAGWGRHWTAPDSGMFNVDPKNYNLSRPTESYHSFLSHDWASSAWLKFLSLLIIFNARAAFFACLLVSTFSGALQGCDVIPKHDWMVYVGHFTYFFVMVFWQRLRQPFLRPCLVFLDKLCVAQHDEVLKQKGIRGIAAFLLNSEKLVVLLTPRYFTRLWCTFEIATFMKDHKRRKNIEFMPLKSTAIMLMVSGCWFVVITGWNIVFKPHSTGENVEDVYATTILLLSVMFLICSAFLPFVSYLGMGMLADMDDIPRQLREFRVQDSECFCCSNRHRHPNTNRRLPCDRVMVYNMLVQWYADADVQPEFGRAEGEEHCYLETFNMLVRDELGPRMARLAGGYTLPASYTMYLVGASSMPYVTYLLDTWIHGLRDGRSGLAAAVWMARTAVIWGIVLVSSLVGARVSTSIWKVGLRLCWDDSRLARGLVACFLNIVIFGIIGSLWASILICAAVTEDHDWLPVILFIPCWMMTVWLYSPGSQQKLSPSRSMSGLQTSSESRLQIGKAASDDTFSV